MRGLADISTHIMANEKYSIEFTTEGIYRCMSVRFWREDSLVLVELHRHHQPESYPGCYLTAISCLLSIVSSKPNLVSISGCSSMIFGNMRTVQPWDSVSIPFQGLLPFSIDAPRSIADWLHLRPN